ncbi:MAG: hypothetical protein WKG00_28105 [Polyangiaceae bacterium]
MYLPALRSGATLRVMDTAGAWDDVGSVDSYLTANLRCLRRAARPRSSA